MWRTTCRLPVWLITVFACGYRSKSGVADLSVGVTFPRDFHSSRQTFWHEIEQVTDEGYSSATQHRACAGGDKLSQVPGRKHCH